MSHWYYNFHEEIHDLVAGTVGGVSGILVGQPFDLIKVRLQSGIQSGSAITVGKQILQKEGVLSLWKGILPPIIANVPINAIGFATYGQAQRYLTIKLDGFNSRTVIPATPMQTQLNFYTNELTQTYSLPQGFISELHASLNRPLSPLTRPLTMTSSLVPDGSSSPPNWLAVFIAGFWSGLISCVISTPSDLVKIQEQKVVGATSSWHIANDIVAKYGLMSLYRGFWITVWRDAPSVGLYFLIYEYLKWGLRKETWTPQLLVDGNVTTPEESHRSFGRDGDRGPLGGAGHGRLVDGESPSVAINWQHNLEYRLWVPLLAGAFAGPISWLSTYPLDVVKTRLQSMTQEEFKQTSMVRYTRQLWREKGPRFFSLGLGPTLVSAVPTTAVTFLFYEKTLEMCKRAHSAKTGRHSSTTRGNV